MPGPGRLPRLSRKRRGAGGKNKKGRKTETGEEEGRKEWKEGGKEEGTEEGENKRLTTKRQFI